jgi:hypothetical protein
MGWRCEACPATDPGNDLTFPIIHELLNEGHKVLPDASTVFAWERVLRGKP